MVEYRPELNGKVWNAMKATSIVQNLGSVNPHSYPCRHVQPHDLWCRRWAMSRQLTSTPPPPPSIDHTPPPTPCITLKIGKNIEQQSYNRSPENQSAVVPQSLSIPYKSNCPKVARIVHYRDLAQQQGEMSLQGAQRFRQVDINLYCTKYQFNWHTNQCGGHICIFILIIKDQDIIDLNTSCES